MYSREIWGGCSRIHWQRATPVAATFIAASLAPYRFLLKAVRHEDTYLKDVQSICISNDNTGWKESSARLDAAQSKEVDRAYMFIREIGENIIVPLLHSVEVDEQARRLVKFDQRFKDPNRLKNKVADRLRLVSGRTPIEGLAAIQDTVRFMFQYMENDYVTGIRRDMERLRDRGLIFVSLHNTWSDDQYKGINTRWREPTSGISFEVQFHTRASFTAREFTHKAYERIRGEIVLVGGMEMATLREFQRQVNAMIPIPPGAVEIGEG